MDRVQRAGDAATAGIVAVAWQMKLRSGSGLWGGRGGRTRDRGRADGRSLWLRNYSARPGPRPLGPPAAVGKRSRVSLSSVPRRYAFHAPLRTSQHISVPAFAAVRLTLDLALRVVTLRCPCFATTQPARQCAGVRRGATHPPAVQPTLTNCWCGQCSSGRTGTVSNAQQPFPRFLSTARGGAVLRRVLQGSNGKPCAGIAACYDRECLMRG